MRDTDEDTTSIDVETGRDPPNSDSHEQSDEKSEGDESVAGRERPNGRDQWIERLNEYKQELESTSDTERRRELVEIITEVENGLVEKDLMEESERGDYSIQPATSQDDSARRSESGDAGPSVSDLGDRGTNRESGNQASESQSKSQSRTPGEPSGDAAQDTEHAGENEDSERADESDGNQGSGAEAERIEGSPEVQDSSSDDLSAEDREPSESVNTQSESADRPDEQSAGPSSQKTDQPNNTSSECRDGPFDNREENKEDTSSDIAEESVEIAVNTIFDSNKPLDTSSEHPNEPVSSGVVEDADQSNKRESDPRSETKTDQTEDVADLTERVAELENLFDEFKRSNEHEHQEIRKYSIEEFAENMLRVRDTLERAVELFDWDGEKRERMEAIISQFDQQYTAREISAIEPEAGTELDYNHHEVVDREQHTDSEKNTILRVDRKGFKLGERVIRPAQVVIAA